MCLAQRRELPLRDVVGTEAPLVERPDVFDADAGAVDARSPARRPGRLSDAGLQNTDERLRRLSIVENRKHGEQNGFSDLRPSRPRILAEMGDDSLYRVEPVIEGGATR